MIAAYEQRSLFSLVRNGLKLSGGISSLSYLATSLLEDLLLPNLLLPD